MTTEYDEMLTEEERAALAVDGDDAGELDTKDPDTGEDAADAQAAADAGDEEDTPDTGAEEVDPVEVDDPAPQAEAAPVQQQPQVDLAAVNQTIDAYKADRKALLDQFNDGDLTDDEFSTKLDELDETVADARYQQRVAQQYAEQETQQWQGAVEQHMSRYPQFQENKAALTAFDRMVREVTSDPDYANMSFSEQLENAHAMLEVKAQRTGMQGVPPLKAGKQAPKRTAPKGEDLGDAPRTLAKAPASEITDNDDEFSTLRALEDRSTDSEEDAERYEAAMARMSQAERDRFSSMA